MIVDHLVLCGGGHTHALILRRWAMKPYLRPFGLITLVNRSSTTIYSGMFPGVVSGKYSIDEISIDLRTLAAKAGVAFVKSEITGIDLANKSLTLLGRQSMDFSLISLDIGSETNFNVNDFPAGKDDLICPIKPFEKALDWISDQDSFAESDSAYPLAVFGAGLAGLEIVFALRKRWPNRCLHLHSKGHFLSKSIRKYLHLAKIDLKEKTELISFPSLICTGSKASSILKNSGLLVNQMGRIRTTRTMQSLEYPELFAVGDCGVIDEEKRPPSGVWAVRAAKPLAINLERISNRLSPIPWIPQKKAFQLLRVDFEGIDPFAFCCWGDLMVANIPFLETLKEKIDRRFISKFNFRKKMNLDNLNKEELNSCRGCAAKLGDETLSAALEKADLINLSKQPEDAHFVGYLNSGHSLIQSVDGFPALLSDAWLNGRLTALHACSDIWASGASVTSAEALITVPSVAKNLQKELLAHSLDGIKSVLSPLGAKIIGGHTFESRSRSPNPISMGLEVSLCINGLVDRQDKLWTKSGLQPGDHLLISRALGTGVIFAAAMQGMVPPFYLDTALRQMNKSQHELIKSLISIQRKEPNLRIVNSCTDITGFGLLGHLSEMLRSSNLYRIKQQLSILKINLKIQDIPSLKGVLELFYSGFSSTLAPSNRHFLKFINSNYDPQSQFELTLDNVEPGSYEYQTLLELIVDPQTCGPIVISCSEESANKLIKIGPWKSIGKVIG